MLGAFIRLRVFFTADKMCCPSVRLFYQRCEALPFVVIKLFAQEEVEKLHF